MRWKFIIPFLVFILIIVGFVTFFLDGIVESVVEERASLLNRAKVEIEDLDIGFLRPGVRIRGLAVANADNPWRNMVEVGDIGISVSVLPLFSKRIVIDEMVMEKVQINTKRKTSGELPPAPEEKAESQGEGGEETRRGSLCEITQPRCLQEEIRCQRVGGYQPPGIGEEG